MYECEPDKGTAAEFEPTHDILDTESGKAIAGFTALVCKARFRDATGG